MKTLVVGGTGTVGSEVVSELLKRNVEVSILTRSQEKLAALPTNAKGVVGDLLDPTSVRSVFKGFERVFMLNPVSPTETHEGLMAINGARDSGVQRMVYMSVHDVDKAPHLPHFGAKLPIETALAASGIAHTILRPNNFYQNDVWFKDAIMGYGVYPQPIGSAGLSRVDVRDIAEAAAVALTTDGHEGQVYNLVGPDVHTGKSTADVWARVLGKAVAYAGDDLEAWEQQSLQYMPAWMVFDFKLMYAFFQKNGLKATSADIERQTKLIGHAPRSFDDFAAECAAQWQ